ncbi:hypothetical protein ACGFMK_27620 [Amycolatopsis sp. NPDC049252]|uniref:hypothetical protein n=1 Tax=Amycolatopsis sp. NPDC049252 TaxID=3363933 RepID=UPI00371F0E5E
MLREVPKRLRQHRSAQPIVLRRRVEPVAQLVGGRRTVGDPQEVVDAILFAADTPNPPLRIAVGDEARSSIRAALRKQLGELETTA